MSGTAVAHEIACVPSAIPAERRQAHFALARELFRERALERSTLPNGYAFRFEPDELEAIARFIADERRCCPFMSFELTLTTDALWLRMTGPEGTRGVLDAELNLTRACGCK